MIASAIDDEEHRFDRRDPDQEPAGVTALDALAFTDRPFNEAEQAHLEELIDATEPPELERTPYFDGARMVYPELHVVDEDWEPDPRSGEEIAEAIATLGARPPDGPGEGGEPPAEDSGPAAEPPDPLADLTKKFGLRSLLDIPKDAPRPLLLGRLDDEGHTIAFGGGGVGKGTVVAHWICGLVAAGHIVLILDYEAHPGEWARRIGALGGVDALGGVYYLSPTGPEWKGRRGAIWKQQEELRLIADTMGATYVVIDSIVPASGATDPLKPEAPSQYHAALAYIGRPALSLAHVTKTDDLRYPFGSVFWHNLCRVSWSLSDASQGDPGSHVVLLANRKANNHLRQPKTLITVTWLDGLPREVWEQSYAARLTDLIDTALADGPRTATAIVAWLNADKDDDDPPFKADTVRKALRRGIKSLPKRFTVTGDGETSEWSSVR